MTTNLGSVTEDISAQCATEMVYLLTIGKPRPQFQDMPKHVKEGIVAHASITSRFTLRKVSPEMRRFVDKTEYFYDTLHLKIHENAVVIVLISGNDSLERMYQFKHNDCFLTIKDGRGERKRLLFERDYLACALIDLLTVFKNPKTHFDFLIVEIVRRVRVRTRFHLMSDYDCSQQHRTLSIIHALLRGLKIQLPVHNFRMIFDKGEENILQILPLLKPVTLRSIYLDKLITPDIESTKLEFNELVKLEQWKRAVKLQKTDFRIISSVEEWAHFPSVYLITSEMSPRYLIPCVENLRSRDPSSWKTFTVQWRQIDHSLILRIFTRYDYSDTDVSTRKLIYFHDGSEKSHKFFVASVSHTFIVFDNSHNYQL